MLRVMLKLKLIKIGLRDWNSKSFDNIFFQIAEEGSPLQDVQNRMAALMFSEAIFQEEIQAHVALDSLL